MTGNELENEIKFAIFELHNLNEFLIELSELDAEEIVEKVEAEYPEFIKHIEAMENPPDNASEFLDGFSIWSISRLSSKYSHIWKQVIGAYFKSDIHREFHRKLELRSKINSQIEDILKKFLF